MVRLRIVLLVGEKLDNATLGSGTKVFRVGKYKVTFQIFQTMTLPMVTQVAPLVVRLI